MIFILFSKLDCPPVARLAASKRSRSLSFLDLCAESAVPCKRGNFSKCRQFYVLPLAFHHIKRLEKSKRENSERLGLPIRFCFFLRCEYAYGSTRILKLNHFPLGAPAPLFFDRVAYVRAIPGSSSIRKMKGLQDTP